MGGQCGEAALASEETCEGPGEAGQRPDVSLTGRMEVDALAASLLLGGVVFGSQRVEIVRCDGLSRRGGCRLLVTSRFALIPFAAAEVHIGGGVQLHFLEGGERIVLDDHGISA